MGDRQGLTTSSRRHDPTTGSKQRSADADVVMANGGCRFVQGVWGGPQCDGWKSKMVANVVEPRGSTKHNIGRLSGTSGATLSKRLKSVVYAMGKPAAQLLRDNGLDPIVIDDGEKTADALGWHRKLLMMRDALERCEAIVWLDMDSILLTNDLPPDFWSRMHTMAPLQAKIRQYHRRHCTWRRACPRTLQGGAFIYCRSIPVLDRVIEISKWFDGKDDEKAIAYAIDEMCGGWPGLDGYRDFGFDPPWYTIRGEIHACGAPVFTAR